MVIVKIDNLLLKKTRLMKKCFTYSLIIISVIAGNLLSGNNDLKKIRIPEEDVLLVYKDIKVHNGGFGSSIAVNPNDSSYFYILTDRGPCVNYGDDSTKIFAVPAFTPQIGKFKFENDSLKLISVIKLKDKNGNPLSGLPNLKNYDKSETILKDLYEHIFEKDSLGIDPEGLVALSDGTFWISDEYGPNLLHVDSTGKTIERINPYSTGQRFIPKVFARREYNGGMEGLTVTPNGKTLVGIMQSPLYNPSKSDVNNSLVTRILFFDIQTGATKQYVYLLEETNTNASEIAAITDTTFLVLERDGDFLFGSPQSLYKAIYKININGAKDISDPANSTSGKLIKSKTIEELEDRSTLISKGIVPVKKTLIVNLVDSNYLHDKPEGLIIINNHLIAVCNDDDFGIEKGDKNLIAEKKVPDGYLGKFVDYNELVFITLPEPLINPVTNVERYNSLISAVFELKQNYPNPFNPITNIQYTIDRDQFVSLSVYDVLGREVALLVNKKQSAGKYSVKFDAKRLPSGIYFSKLQGKDHIEIKKMIFIK